jgi:hypothetical protein
VQLPDRLLRLSTWRLALRQAGLATPEAVLAAPPELRHRYRHCFADVLRVVERWHPDVLLALFWPRPAHGVDWQAAILGSGASAERLLLVDRGPIGSARERLMTVIYRIDDDTEGPCEARGGSVVRDGGDERAAWRSLVRTLRAANLAKAVGILLNLADQESASAACSSRKGAAPARGKWRHHS